MAQASPRHSVSVAAAIIDQAGRLLAVRRSDNGHWEPPGGVLELDETIHAGLVREVHEETGLEVEPDALTGIYKNMRRGIIALVRVAYDLEDRPVEVCDTVMAADRYVLSYELPAR